MVPLLRIQPISNPSHGGRAYLVLSLGCWAATGDYKFGLNETAIGMSLPVFGIQLATARLSRRHLTQAVTQATIYDTTQALDVGYLDAVKDAESLLDDAIAEAHRLGEFDTESYSANKRRWRAPYIEAIEASLSN